MAPLVPEQHFHERGLASMSHSAFLYQQHIWPGKTLGICDHSIVHTLMNVGQQTAWEQLGQSVLQVVQGIAKIYHGTPLKVSIAH